MTITILICVVLLEIERRILALSGPSVCYNNATKFFRCCTGFKSKDGKCVPCPPGKYGIGCTETCVPGYFGEFCLSKCNCSTNVLCKPDTGCDDPFSENNDNQTYRNVTAYDLAGQIQTTATWLRDNDKIAGSSFDLTVVLMIMLISIILLCLLLESLSYFAAEQCKSSSCGLDRGQV